MRDVSKRLLGGAVGTLRPDIAEWVERNEAALGEPAEGTEIRPLDVIAQSTSAFPYRWWLLRGGASVRAAAAAFHVLQGASWHRHTTDFSVQDALNLADLGPGSAHESVMTFFAAALPAAMHGLGLGVQLQDVVAHRLRRGDRVGPHNDAEQRRFHVRAVLGLTPGDIAGGQLRLCGDSSGASLSVLPGFGDVFVIEPNARSYHEVEAVRDERCRLSAVGSYSDLSRTV